MKRCLGIVTVALMACCGLGYAAGGAGVGITSPPCGIDQPPPFPPCNFPLSDCEGNHPNYETAILTFNDRINTDLDILYSSSFQEYASRDATHPGWQVTGPELEELAIQLDGNPNLANPLGSDYQNKWDVELVFNYYTHGSILYGGFGLNSNFRFDNQFIGQLETERNHADVYLVPLFEFVDQPGCVQSIQTGGYGCCLTAAGRVPAVYTDDDEDFPFSTGPMAEQCPPGTNVPEFHDNSLQIWDHWGNYANVVNWQQASTVTFDHEFEHMIQNDRFGAERGLSEFFATTAEYLGHPVYPPGTGDLTSDVCYDNPVSIRRVEPLQTSQPNYQIWRTWGVYLLQQFRSGSGIGDDLVRAWNREHPPGSPLAAQRDLRSLPSVLESANYDKLGCSTCIAGYKGQFRLQELNNRIAVARWVDEPNFQPGWLPPTGEGPWGYFLGFDPGRDVGIFRKISSDVSHCDYSHTVPPVYLLGSAHLNNQSTVTCYIDPRDPVPCPSGSGQCADLLKFCYRQSSYCGQGCGDPIDLYPWGADVVGFVAGTPFMDGNYYELETRFEFGSVPGFDCDLHPIRPPMPCSYRYFINVITYNTNDTVSDLWDRGEQVTSITTYGPYFATSARSLRFNVGDFECPLIRSVAFVISLADSATIHPDVQWETHARLDYSYIYQVKNPNPGPGYVCPSAEPGCPFVYVEGPAGFLVDNSILGEGAWHTDRVPNAPDVTDEYALSRSVEVRDGRVQLELREDGSESTSLDAVRLVAYDVPPGMTLARLVPSSQVGLVTSLSVLNGLRDRYGRDVTADLSEVDGRVVEGEADAYVRFDWVKTANVGIEIIVVDPLLKQPPPGGWGPPPSRPGLTTNSVRGGDSSLVGEGRGIVLQARVGQGWVDVVDFVPRDRGERQGVPTAAIPGQPGEVVPLRLLWRNHHKLDWLGVGVWVETEGTTLSLTEATHSEHGDVRARLVATDRDYATLDPGERIHLSFAGYTPSPNRQLCLASRGHYVIPRGFAADGTNTGPRIKVDEQHVDVAAPPPGIRVISYPNPSYGSATIEMQLEIGERVEVAVYSTDGHLVRRVHAGPVDAGVRRFLWDGRSELGRLVPSGQYYYRVTGGSWARSGKVFLIK